MPPPQPFPRCPMDCSNGSRTCTTPGSGHRSRTAGNGPVGEKMLDPFDLERFVLAQDDDGTFDRATEELRNGRKTSHWMWFVFPQLAGLGTSAMARQYALDSLDEALAYLQHPVLRARLLDCAGLVNRVENRSIHQILGSP